MSNRNDITGDKIINKKLSKEGEDNWDLIFPKKKKETLPEYELNKSTGEVQKVDVKKLTEAHNGH
jgi:hypothetical protein